MCKFFSFVGDGYGNFKFIDWETRRKWLEERSENFPDSHARILTHFKVPPKFQDRWSKYEYNPLTKQFTIDEPVEGHDHEVARSWVEGLDFKKVAEPLILKEIVNPLKGRAKKPLTKDIKNLEKWASVGASVGDSVWDLVRDLVWDLVGASVGASVGGSVRGSVWGSVWDSVRGSVWDSVEDSVGAYLSSFFPISYPTDLSSGIELWNRGFIPSFDGTTWRLRSGKGAEVVYKWVPKTE